MLPLVGTLPFFLISLGFIRTNASSENEENALYAWSARIFRSAKNNILGLRVPSNCRFHLDSNSFQAI
jgi:hypothetical protein